MCVLVFLVFGLVFHMMADIRKIKVCAYLGTVGVGCSKSYGLRAVAFGNVLHKSLLKAFIHCGEQFSHMCPGQNMA